MNTAVVWNRPQGAQAAPLNKLLLIETVAGTYVVCTRTAEHTYISQTGVNLGIHDAGVRAYLVIR